MADDHVVTFWERRLPKAIRELPRRYRSSILVALAGYTVVGLLGLTYWIVRSKWTELGPRTAVILAAIVSTPLVLSMIWNRMISLKVFGVEVSLTQAIAPIEQKISSTPFCFCAL